MHEWYDRLIANAEKAKADCKSNWGKQYWQSVIRVLWRRLKLLEKEIKNDYESR